MAQIQTLQPPPPAQTQLYLQPPSTEAAVLTHVLPQDGGGLTPAPEQAHTPQPPPAIPYHIYQNVVLAALNSGTAAGLGQPLVAAAAAATTSVAAAQPPPPLPPATVADHQQPKVSVAPATITHSLFNDLQVSRVDGIKENLLKAITT